MCGVVWCFVSLFFLQAGAEVSPLDVPLWNQYKYYVSGELGEDAALWVSSTDKYAVWLYGHMSTAGYGYSGAASLGTKPQR